ncbi:hypothetical protein PSU4_52310 [Pseudonocardia sulfidoxydans NBRC 16205]|uniref:Uncharacterized protein n=1 Tax=Pseudonocardia sulfidoxydans NBRC 16205 TaxID=1223511 RepID=A0A511DPJ5_9PSEU|nr:hypothetical protein [Pseudonocardia sulfidoxydans]GEL26277.1 hypothetical protein PSU4_52310 [Pseudonocardia sulfidoxydans NBRC 16205]
MSGNSRYSDYWRSQELAERLGYTLSDAQLAEMAAAVEAAEPAAARLRADPPLDDGWPVDPAHGDAWLRAR